MQVSDQVHVTTTTLEVKIVRLINPPPVCNKPHYKVITQALPTVQALSIVPALWLYHSSNYNSLISDAQIKTLFLQIKGHGLKLHELNKMSDLSVAN